MVGTLGAVVAIVAAIIVVVAIVYFSLVLRRGRALGTRGLVQRSRLACPKCHGAFDYDWVPGASISAVRLGTSRYMACPLCGKWSVFDVYDTMVGRS